MNGEANGHKKAPYSGAIKNVDYLQLLNFSTTLLN